VARGGRAYYTVAPNRFYSGNPLSVIRDGTTTSSPSELAQILRSYKPGSGRGAADGRVFLRMLEHPGGARRQGGTAEEGTAELLPLSDQRNTILRCITTPFPSTGRAREALIPWALSASHRRLGSLATSFLVSGSPLLVEPGVDVAAPVARRPANLDECRPGPLLPPPF
jgi:hypothetical protein